jgi:hypothetical protein
MPLYNEEDMQATISRVLTKLEMSREEFDKIMAEPGKQHSNYPVSLYLKIYPFLVKILKLVLRKN